LPISARTGHSNIACRAHIEGILTMILKKFLDRVSEISFAKLDKVGGDAQKLCSPFQEIAIVTSAQGLIDNGGLEHFFTWTFPGAPSYTFLANCYRKIGAVNVADTIEAACAYFGTEHPETNLALRLEFIASLPSDCSHEFSKISTRICGDSSVWTCLENYVEHYLSEIEAD